ncbi:MAG TPA: hypothetical protein PLU22_12345 [Polyangiaceae bacterium]|nr:hypothetical protein [Polyangiaceae bacterium]
MSRSPLRAARRAAIHLGLVVSLGLGAVGCRITSGNTVVLAPLDTEFPISASSSFRDAEGRTVTEDDFVVVHEFTFERSVEARRHREVTQSLDLRGDLAALVARYSGDAIVGLMIDG